MPQLEKGVLTADIEERTSLHALSKCTRITDIHRNGWISLSMGGEAYYYHRQLGADAIGDQILEGLRQDGVDVIGVRACRSN